MTKGLKLVVGCAPNTPAGDLETLLALADEVFVGYVPRAWLLRYGAEVSPNRRHAVDRQYTSRDALARLAERARSHGTSLTVTLNEHHAPPGADDLLDVIVRDAVEVGAAGFVIADLDGLAFVKDRVPEGTRLALSNEAGAYSAEAARTYLAAGATRLIFPREMRVCEMASIASAVRADAAERERPAPELEAFVAREFCPNSSSLCYTTHGYGRPAHFCFAHDRQTLREVTSGEITGELPRLPPGWTGSRETLGALMVWHRCGLCAIAALRGFGVNHLKIPGRSGSALTALRATRALVDRGDLSEAACRATVGVAAFCEGGEHCYYDLADVRRASSSPGHRRPTPPPVRRLQGTARAHLGHHAPTRTRPAVRYPNGAPDLAVALVPESCTPEAVAALAEGGLSALAETLALTPWERAAAERTLAFLDEVGLEPERPPARVVIDYSACALRWPRPAALVSRVRTIRSAGFEAAIALPVAFEAHTAEIAEGLAAVTSALDLAPSVLANDLGGLAIAAASGLPVEAGRLLNRMKRDQLSRDEAALPAASDAVPEAAVPGLRRAQDAAYGSPYLDRGAYAELFRAFQVRRLAWDTLPTPLSSPLSGAFAASLWAPWSYLTSARACPLAIALDGASPAHPTTGCHKSCVTHALELSFPYPHAPTYRHGATAVLDTSEELPAFYASADGAFSELVVSLQLPR